jgi:hypothetical protein
MGSGEFNPAYFRASMPRYPPDDDRQEAEVVGRGLENGMRAVSPIGVFWGSRKKEGLADFLEPVGIKIGTRIFYMTASDGEIVFFRKGPQGQKEAYFCDRDPLVCLVLIEALRRTEKISSGAKNLEEDYVH